jgi:hypothetical protein
METRLRKGNLIVVLPLEEPRLSATEKTLVVASSRGVRQTTMRLDGKIVWVNANAWVRPDDPDGARQPVGRKKHIRGEKSSSRSARKKGHRTK